MGRLGHRSKARMGAHLSRSQATVAENILQHGTGALNIDATRVPTSQGDVRSSHEDSTVCTCSSREVSPTVHNEDTRNPASPSSRLWPAADLQPNAEPYVQDQKEVPDFLGDYPNGRHYDDAPALLAEEADQDDPPSVSDEGRSLDHCAKCGRIRADLSKPYGTIQNIQQTARWPANLIHDGSDEVLAAFPAEAGGGGRDSRGRVHQAFTDDARKSVRDDVHEGFGDSGSAARFFYTAKADAEDRLGSKHPTVKPLDLMQYLVRLVTPPNGVVLDPFSGTGTTGEAAWREGMRAILIEREPEYQADIVRRMELAANPTKRAAVAASKNNLQGAEGTPLFLLLTP